MRSSSTADRVWAVIALVLSVGGAVAGIIPAFMLSMASDSCSTGCSTVVLTVGWLAAIIAPPVVALIGAVVTTTALIRGAPAAKRAWGYLLLQAGVFFAAVTIVFMATGW